MQKYTTKDEKLQQLSLELKDAKEKNREIEMVQQIIAVGIRALSVRMLTTLVLVADFVLFAGAVYLATWQSIVAAVLFAIATWAVLFLKPERKVDPE